MTLVLGVLALWVIAACVIADLVRPARAPATELDPPASRPRSPAPVFAPLACGIAATYAGLTGPCCRRRNHPPPCLTEEALEQLVAVGPVTTVVPLARPDDVEFGETQA